MGQICTPASQDKIVMDNNIELLYARDVKNTKLQRTQKKETRLTDSIQPKLNFEKLTPL